MLVPVFTVTAQAATHASDITMTITTSYVPLHPDIQPWADYFNSFLSGSSTVTYHDNENLELTVLPVLEAELLNLIQDLIHTKGITEVEFDDAESHIFIEWVGQSSSAWIMLQWVAANQQLVISVEIGFGSVTPTVTSVSVSPYAVNVEQGTAQQFNATVMGTNDPPQTVTWEVTADTGILDGTSISASGLLTVGANQFTSGAALTVTATSTLDVTRYGTAVVTVTDTPVTPEVISVEVYPPTASVERGQQRQFTAYVAVQGGASQTVTWEVNSTSGSTINSDGLLTVASDETAATLTVTATSIVDGTKYGAATITITSLPIVITHTVTFNGNGGTPSEASRAVNNGAAIGTLPTASRGDHLFNGWFTASSGGTQISASTVVTENITYYAQWTFIGGGAGGGDTSGVGSGYTVATGSPAQPPRQTQQPTQTTPEEESEPTETSETSAPDGVFATIEVLPSMSARVSVDIGDVGDINYHRLVAIHEDGTIVGGSYNPETGLFEFEATLMGEYTIEYVENLNRLVVQIGSNLIIDLAANASTQVMDVVPVIQDGRTLLPIRFMAYALGADVDWNDDTREVTLTLDGISLTFAIGETVSGMDVPAQIIDGRTMVPLRFISEFFGAIVIWNQETQSIEIIKA
jgi:uncharacterized repeat protein (TIGR02543 family)